MESLFNTQKNMLARYITCVSLIMLIHNYILVTHTHTCTQLISYCYRAHHLLRLHCTTAEKIDRLSTCCIVKDQQHASSYYAVQSMLLHYCNVLSASTTACIVQHQAFSDTNYWRRWEICEGTMYAFKLMKKGDMTGHRKRAWWGGWTMHEYLISFI